MAVRLLHVRVGLPLAHYVDFPLSPLLFAQTCPPSVRTQKSPFESYTT